MAINDYFSILESIWSLIRAAINQDYESFEFVAYLHEGYIETNLCISVNGVKIDANDDNINYSILISLVKELKASATREGDWRSFAIFYEVGGQVKTKFRF